MHISEVNFVVKNALTSLDFYQKVFEVEEVEVGDFILGQNEVAIRVDNLYFRILDENPDFQMFAPTEESSVHSWFNIIVSDIEYSYAQAVAEGAKEIQAVKELPEMGIKNAVFKDPFGYVWLLHEVVQEIDYDTRVQILEQQGFQRQSKAES